MADPVNFARVRVLPEFPLTNTIYFVQPNQGDPIRQFVTGDDGQPVEVSAASASQQLFEAGYLAEPTVGAMVSFLKGVGIALNTSQGQYSAIPGDLVIGNAPGNVRYEMNAGAFGRKTLQVSSVGDANTGSVMELLRFADTSKAAIFQIGKSRGHGDPNGDPATFHRKSLQGNRLVAFAFYGSSDAGFSHAGYLTVSADRDNTGTNNNQPGLLHLCTSNAVTQGNGISMNCLSQVRVEGPNEESLAPNVDTGAILSIGPASASIAPVRYTYGPLVTTPLTGAREYDGDHHVTNGGGVRKLIATAPALVFGTLTAGIDPAPTLLTARRGLDWLEITLTPSVDYTNGFSTTLGLCRQNITALPGNVVLAVIGSCSTVDMPPAFTYLATATSLRVGLPVGQTVKAGVTYTFTLLWRTP